MTGLSVLTLVSGRDAQLSNLVAGLAAQERAPDELVIATMGGHVTPSLAAPFPIVTVAVGGHRLPLAAARNAAVRTARHDGLVFLDVDCIPAPGLVGRYRRCLEAHAACVMGEVRYLPMVPHGPLDFAALEAVGVRHPAKAAPPDDVAPEPDHGELWGLSFALGRAAFEAAGGFDERFEGYGSEETDFARALGAAGVPLMRTGGALAYHQAHSVHIPPLQHFADIVRNAALFHDKWGAWSMDYWLGQLAAAGYIEWTPTADRIVVLRHPDSAAIEFSRAPEGTLFS